MIITVAVPDRVGVDGEFRQVDLSDLDPLIRTIQFDDQRKTGVIEFIPTAETVANERDFEAEKEAYDKALREGKNLNELGPIFKARLVRRPRQVINSFERFQYLLERWSTAT